MLRSISLLFLCLCISMMTLAACRLTSSENNSRPLQNAYNDSDAGVDLVEQNRDLADEWSGILANAGTIFQESLPIREFQKRYDSLVNQLERWTQEEEVKAVVGEAVERLSQQDRSIWFAGIARKSLSCNDDLCSSLILLHQYLAFEYEQAVILDISRVGSQTSAVLIEESDQAYDELYATILKNGYRKGSGISIDVMVLSEEDQARRLDEAFSSAKVQAAFDALEQQVGELYGEAFVGVAHSAACRSPVPICSVFFKLTSVEGGEIFAEAVIDVLSDAQTEVQFVRK